MDALQPGDPGSVGGYRLLGRLGVGGMGQVFLGVSPGGRQVAVKLIHPVHAQDAQFRERFAREIEAARRVGGFHTAPVVDADPHADPPWMVTAYIEGLSLQEAVGRGGPLPPGRVRVLGAGLAEGLAAIHACGLVHRDLKPGNVIMAADGPRIIDFGIARTVDASTGITATGAVVGTFAYMSPEQIRGEVAGPASDVFSVGGVLAFVATGRPPFGDDSAVSIMYRIVNQPPDLAGLRDGELREVIGACLAKSATDRPSVQAILAALSGPATMSVIPSASAVVRASASPLPAARDYETLTRTRPSAPLRAGPDQGALPQPAAAPLVTQTTSVTRPRRGRRMLVIGGGLTVAVAALLLATLWPSSPRHAGSDPRTSATAAATPVGDMKSPCGTTCIVLYSPSHGESEVLAVVGGDETAGQPVNLQPPRAYLGNGNWIADGDRTVSSYYADGLVSAAFDKHYRSNEAYEYQYVPLGVYSGLCLGVDGTAQNGTAVTLQPCGVSAATLWVPDTADRHGQQVPLINATNTNFTHPFVLTANGTSMHATTSSLTETSGGFGNGQYWSTEHWG
jgi:hypothetical protein